MATKQAYCYNFESISLYSLKYITIYLKADETNALRKCCKYNYQKIKYAYSQMYDKYLKFESFQFKNCGMNKNFYLKQVCNYFKKNRNLLSFGQKKEIWFIEDVIEILSNDKENEDLSLREEFISIFKDKISACWYIEPILIGVEDSDDEEEVAYYQQYIKCDYAIFAELNINRLIIYGLAVFGKND